MGSYRPVNFFCVAKHKVLWLTRMQRGNLGDLSSYTLFFVRGGFTGLCPIPKILKDALKVTTSGFYSSHLYPLMQLVNAEFYIFYYTKGDSLEITRVLKEHIAEDTYSSQSTFI
jgi:hypothetical protein